MWEELTVLLNATPNFGNKNMVRIEIRTPYNVHPTRTEINLRIRSVWCKPSLTAQGKSSGCVSFSLANFGPKCQIASIFDQITPGRCQISFSGYNKGNLESLYFKKLNSCEQHALKAWMDSTIKGQRILGFEYFIQMKSAKIPIDGGNVLPGKKYSYYKNFAFIEWEAEILGGHSDLPWK